ncbi:MAG: polyribonucleotide nucleotidyltransferase [Planctomycetaceae bacterium]|nr:polyribonucleotide nucleotidyltransferase [Planctomycetaceae bacterium]
MTTGEIAKQASGAVMIQYGETSLLVAAQTGPAREGIDFFPMTVDYRERFSAAGKFPGGFIKREGRPSTHEILTARLTDRPLRPLFPKSFHDEVQIQSMVLSCDLENPADVISINGASAALTLAPVPFQGPIGAVRVGLEDGNLILFPTNAQAENGDLDLVVAGNRESILMIEGFGRQIPEEQMADALMFAHRSIAVLCEMQEELASKAGVEPCTYEDGPENPFLAQVRQSASAGLKAARQNPKKSERSEAAAAVRQEMIDRLFPEGATEDAEGRTLGQLKDAFYQVDKEICRQLTLSGNRLDGRTTTDLRDVTCRVGIIPRVHGSALFTRGETQSMATLTLGTVRDQQKVEDLFGEHAKRFMLDYNFPSYSVGEVRPIRGPGRREIGHGALAERSVQWVLPEPESFPYTVRIISDITESNGSSSMASVCNATLALMDAGVPIKQPVAGISIGLVKEGSDYVLLTDIIGDEDHFGDMDFKVAGTQKGITGIQLDLKIDGINEEIIRKTLEQARKARLELLRSMLTEIRRPRKEISLLAPRIESIKIDPEKIGLIIGPGGKNIRALQEETGTQIDISDDGTVTIAAPSGAGAEAARARIEAMTEDVKVGRVYNGTVIAIKDFGAFVEIAPGKDGLCHISELSNGFVKNVGDVCKIGDKMEVKVIAVDEQNRVKLSRKALLPEPEAADEDSDAADDEDDLDFED